MNRVYKDFTLSLAESPSLSLSLSLFLSLCLSVFLSLSFSLSLAVGVIKQKPSVVGNVLVRICLDNFSFYKFCLFMCWL